MDPETFDAAMTSLVETYRPRIERMLIDIRNTFLKAGWHLYARSPDVTDMETDEPSWDVTVLRPTTPKADRGEDSDLPEDALDITFAIVTERETEGQDDAPGIAFALHAVQVDGWIIGGMTPFNYTRFLWVDIRDAAAVARRFAYFMDADPAELVAVCEKERSG